MINRENYEKEILDAVCKNGLLVVNNRTNKITWCSGRACLRCKFYNTGICTSSFRKWQNDEYIDPPKWEFTEDEKAILRNLPEKYKWIARDGNRLGDICVYEDKPCKCTEIWANRLSCAGLPSFSHIFQTIKWEDEEPCEFRKYI